MSTGDLEDKLATSPSPKFLGLFRGVVYDYEIFDPLTFQRDLARVERFYRARGYYDAHARAGRVIESANHVRVEIVVDEGKPVRVRDVKIEGADGLPSALRVQIHRAAEKSLSAGEPFDEDNLATGLVRVTRALTDDGYARAKVTRDATVDVVAHAADVVFTIDAGGPAVFGPVKIEGLGPLPEAPVRRALDLDEGDPYRTSSLEAARQAVLDLGVFSSVEVVPNLGSSDAAVVPVTVRVEPSQLRTLRLGGGAEFDALKSDVHAVIGWEDRNFLGGFRHYSVSLRPGVVLYPLRSDNWVVPNRLLPEFQLKNEFRQPGFIEARTSGVIRPELNLFPVLVTRQSLPTDAIPGYLEFKTSVGADRTTWKFYTSLTHTVQIEMPFSYVGAKDPALQTLVLSYPELITNLDLSDSRVRPHKGLFVGDTLQVAGGPFGGEATDVRVQPDVRGYVPLGKHATLALRTSVGLLFPQNYGSSLRDDAAEQEVDLPSRIRDLQVVFFRGFFGGGPSSNRGYPLRGIGPYQVVASPAFGGTQSLAACAAISPTLENCRIPVGGTTLWEASAEVRFTVSGPFAMATFCDAADVSATTLDIRLNHPHLSCGVGVRYDTPVGPIRLDVGYRIPGLQVLPKPDPTEQTPNPLFGVLPVAFAFGIGEAY